MSDAAAGQAASRRCDWYGIHHRPCLQHCGDC